MSLGLNSMRVLFKLYIVHTYIHIHTYLQNIHTYLYARSHRKLRDFPDHTAFREKGGNDGKSNLELKPY